MVGSEAGTLVCGVIVELSTGDHLTNGEGTKLTESLTTREAVINHS